MVRRRPVNIGETIGKNSEKQNKTKQNSTRQKTQDNELTSEQSRYKLKEGGGNAAFIKTWYELKPISF